MASIVVRRRGGWVAAIRAVEVFIDGERTGTVLRKRQREFPVAAGSHQVQARLDWTSSTVVTVDVAADQPAILVVKLGARYIRRVITRPRSAIGMYPEKPPRSVEHTNASFSTHSGCGSEIDRSWDGPPLGVFLMG